MENGTDALIERKPTELVGIIGREKMNLLADVVGSKEWTDYRNIYEHATNLGETAYPVQLDFELNASCNLRCQMCPRASVTLKNAGRSTWFKFSKFKEVVDDGVRRGLKAINLSYLNEPLIRDDLAVFVEYARRKGVCDIYFSTNGLLITADSVKALIKAGLTRIQVSIDAVRPETYEQMRPGGKLEQVLANIGTLLEVRTGMGSITPLVRVNFVKTELNKNELNEFVIFWKDRVEMIGVQEMMRVQGGRVGGGADVGCGFARGGGNFRCSVPFHLMVITNDGPVLPCCALLAKGMPIGNIHASSIRELWGSAAMREMRQFHLAGKYDENPICKRCVEDSVK